MKNVIRVLSITFIAGLLFAIGCGDGDSDSDKYTLSEVTPDPVDITLDGDLGTLTFDLSAEGLSDSQYDEFVMAVDDAVIVLTVLNNDTGVGVNLADGTMVDTIPESAGEYMFSMGDDMVHMTFYNEIDGLVLRVGGDYTATIDVMENDEFTTENFPRDAEVQ